MQPFLQNNIHLYINHCTFAFLHVMYKTVLIVGYDIQVSYNFCDPLCWFVETLHWNKIQVYYNFFCHISVYLNNLKNLILYLCMLKNIFYLIIHWIWGAWYLLQHFNHCICELGLNMHLICCYKQIIWWHYFDIETVRLCMY